MSLTVCNVSDQTFRFSKLFTDDLYDLDVCLLIVSAYVVYFSDSSVMDDQVDQSPGTLGNALVNGAQEVKLFGEPVQVRARIAQLGGLSGHADKDGLEAWLRAFDEKPKFVFVNHGEDAVAEHWANHLKEEGYEADAPYNGSIWIAAEGRVACAEVGNTRKIIKTKSAETVRTSAAYDRLANMGQRLLEVIRHNRGGANKDLAKFDSQIAALCDKWDR